MALPNRVNPKFARSLPLFSLWRLTQAHARPTAVFVNELDAGHFQGTPNRQVVSSRQERLAVG
jgi:HAMP domain-containing protein